MKHLILIGSLALLTGCTYEMKVRDGATAYRLKQYDTALRYLPNEFEKTKSRVEKGKIAWMTAESYRLNGRDEDALSWYAKARENQFGPDALREYAYTLKRLERYKDAQAAFKELGSEIGSSYEFRREITASQTSETWLKQIPLAGVKIEPVSWNTARNEFAPHVSHTGVVTYSTDRKGDPKAKDYPWSGNGYSDVVAAAGDIEAPINTPDNEGTAVFSPDGSEVFFTRCHGPKFEDAYCRIWYARKSDDGFWNQPSMLELAEGNFNIGQPALSADGSRLVFSSSDPTGFGGHDLMMAQRNSTGTWSAPKSMPRGINTQGNEMFPSFDGDTLYFSSDLLPGMGGLDIFKTWVLPDGSWMSPQNLKAPLNSGGDDFGLAIDRFTALKDSMYAQGYLTSNRKGGKGGDDIYRFEQRPGIPPPAPPKDTAATAKPVEYKWLLDVYVVEYIYADAANPNSKIVGKRPLIGANLGYNSQTQKTTDVAYRIELEAGKRYVFSAAADGYLAKSATYQAGTLTRDPANPVQTFELEIVLDKVFKNREIVLENIYYDYNRAEIRPDAEPALNELAEILRQNPAIKIQLGSHTDCRGNDTYNQDLSQRRAESAVNYLISKGIETERLSAIGYGEGSPAVTCDCTRCTEDDHQMNRRTTFRIVD